MILLRASSILYSILYMEPQRSFSKTSIVKLYVYKTKQNQKEGIPIAHRRRHADFRGALKSPPARLGPILLYLSFLLYFLSSPHGLAAPVRLSSKGPAAQGAAAPCTCSRVLSCSRPHSRWAAFLATHSQDQSRIPGDRTRCLQNLKRASRHLKSLRAASGMEDGCQLPQLTWKGVTQQTVSPGTPKIFSERGIRACSKDFSLTLWSAGTLPCAPAPSCSSSGSTWHTSVTNGSVGLSAGCPQAPKLSDCVRTDSERVLS